MNGFSVATVADVFEEVKLLDWLEWFAISAEATVFLSGRPPICSVFAIPARAQKFKSDYSTGSGHLKFAS